MSDRYESNLLNFFFLIVAADEVTRDYAYGERNPLVRRCRLLPWLPADLEEVSSVTAEPPDTYYEVRTTWWMFTWNTLVEPCCLRPVELYSWHFLPGRAYPCLTITVFCVSISDHPTGEQGATSSRNPTLHCARGQNPQVSVSLMAQRGPQYEVCLQLAAALTVLGPCWMNMLSLQSSCVFFMSFWLRVYSQLSQVTNNLTHPRFQVTDEEEEADIIWNYNHIKDFRCLQRSISRLKLQ